MTPQSLLLVEDDPDIQRNLRVFLEGEGFQVHSAFNGQEAWQFLQSGNSARVILLDLMMPTMDGYEFLELLRSESNFSRIPVIVVSAIRDLARVAGLLGVPYVKKPIDLEALLAAIDTAPKIEPTPIA